jgi:hypothetical protein
MDKLQKNMDFNVFNQLLQTTYCESLEPNSQDSKLGPWLQNGTLAPLGGRSTLDK